MDAREEVAVKGVYALAAMVRNLPQMHQAFSDSGGGLGWGRIRAGQGLRVTRLG